MLSRPIYQLDWYNAKEFCQRIGMQIAILKTAADVNEVQGNIPMCE
jgi:hypothetical protein